MMIRVPYSPQLAARIAPLFNDERPIPIRMWAILDGVMEGRIVVDDPEMPTFALVQELAEGTAYPGGQVTAAALAAGVAHLRREQDVVVCLWPDDPQTALLPPAPDYSGRAIDFTQRKRGDDLAHYPLPAGYRLHPLDAAIAPRWHGYDYYTTMFGSAARAIQQTLGYCVLYGEEVVSEAVAGPFARGLAELGVGTHPDHGRRGLAAVAAAHVIHACEARGFAAFWNAAYHNAPSVALARRLGFQREQPCNVFMWSRRG